MSTSIRLPIPRDTADALARRSRQWWEPLSRHEAVAAWVELATRTQSVLVATADKPQRLAARLTGGRTTAERRVREEEEARRQRSSESRARPVAESSPAGRRPRVHWDEGGDGGPLLLLNGWTAGGSVWPTAWLRDLERSFRVIRMDTRGSGLSRTAPAPFTMSDLADDAAAVLRSAGAERAGVLGLSMGGMIAQELALRHPALVGELFLVATRPPTPAQIPGSPELTERSFDRPPPGESVQQFLRSRWAAHAAPGFAEREPALLDELVEQLGERRTPRAGVVNQALAVLGWHGPRRLASLRVPTTVVHGEVDPLTPVGNGMRLARLIPGARYVEIPEVGHLVPLEAGDVLADLVRGSVPGAP
ncbi:Pimeloyl-ACP methyl ester carboxylesterase [Geodermatophilus amargosae]|uniref:Pimeloyl-ACP methyl ester carboxylesterase n=1 Tax=Geodermatophilus amargosae TaxID=1296565 RepID=A0A1I7B520_9ACTN|nr:alpha/beta fold hydrolase [Geodermatophilus amargosae]SFT82248.1 Pimeloyl-ACP methyl ester carboxylesterase [Geodermatophilus amargosae]